MAARKFLVTLSVLLALVLLAVLPTGASAAKNEVQPAEVSIQIASANHRRGLRLQLFPAKGVAVVETDQGIDPSFDGRGVDYAIAIPPAPFDGSLDLKFPGLGEFVGMVTPDHPVGAAARAKLCEGSYPGESATFEGHLAFRGAGGYGRWKATKAEASIQLGCGAQPKKENGRDALLGDVLAMGPPLEGPAQIRLFSRGEVRQRFLEFIAWAKPSSNGAEFLAIDREWLPGKVATERWVKKAPVSLVKTIALRFDNTGPASATLTPPAPFFGKGTYSRSTGKLTGSLGVNFLGLKLHLARRALIAVLEDEEPR